MKDATNSSLAARTSSLPLDGGGLGWGWCTIAEFVDTPLPNPPPRRAEGSPSARGGAGNCFRTLAVPMKPDQNAFDRHMMAIALTMARRGLGLTAPNPSVGAVIADEASGEVFARAVTAPGGRPHAETIAIADAGARTRGATIYVTLEPCSHHGKTGPCAEAIIAAGFKRVVVGIEDPDPRVAGRGLDKLRSAGIEVVRGVSAREARWVTRGHIVRVTERRPFVTLKLALDANGDVPHGEGGEPLFVTSPEARAHGHLLRARADAILVGSGTVRADNPELTCRLPGLTARSPLRVVLSRGLDVPLAARVFAGAKRVPTLVVTASGAGAERRKDLEASGAQIVDVNQVGGKLWLPSVMEELVGRGLTRLLVEGGPGMWRAFADAALLDEVALYVAGDGVGSGAKDRLAHGPLQLAQRWLGSFPLSIIENRQIGPDRLWRLRRVAEQKEG